MKEHCVKRFIRLRCWLFGFLVLTGSCGAQPDAERAMEQNLRDALSSLLNNDVYESLAQLEGLLAEHPDFTLAHAFYADLQMSYAHQDILLTSPDAQNKTRINGFKNEAMRRINYTPPPADRLPANILRLADLHKYAIVLDAEKSRLYVFRNDNHKPRLVADYYVAIGKNGMGKVQEDDQKTPLGVYHVTVRLDGQELPELYGSGAYPLNYPNAWDKLAGRNGYGIWLHATPRDIYSRPPLDSRGCIIVSNHLFEDLHNYIEPGHTPVILAQNVEWLTAEQWENRLHTITASFNQWLGDWQNRDIEKYLTHYSTDYRTETEDYPAMTAQVRSNAKRKEYVRVDVDNLDLFLYPDEASANTEMIVAIFDQRYQSNNHNSDYRKQQFWRTEQDGWKIIFADKTNDH